jgi:squalene cyclase
MLTVLVCSSLSTASAADKLDAIIKKTAVQETVDGAPELTEEASASIDRGLKFLLKTQKSDGSWDSDGKGGRVICNTSLALMAFMANAQFPGFGKYGDELDRAKAFLMKAAKSRKDGYLGTTMYEHGLATLALSEMWGMTKNRSDDDAIQKALEAAVEVIKRSQNPGGGWRYQPKADGGEDSSVTAMVFIALASARQAGIMVENEVIAKFRKYVKHAKDGKTGGFSYAPNGNAGTSIACTAGIAYAGQLAGLRNTEVITGAIRLLKKQENIFNGAGHYFYCHYYAIQAMVQAGDKEYANWYPKIRDALVAKQTANGSWGNKAKYGTPMAIIILSTPHRYIPIYQR